MKPFTDLSDPLMSAPRPLNPALIALAYGSGTVQRRHRKRAAVRRGGSVGPPIRAGSGQEVSWPLPASPSSVPRARRLAGGQLAVWGLGGHRETAELLVSELVTNAVRYGGDSIRLGVRARDGLLHIEVEDSGADAPHPRQAGDGDEGGRGLHLVSLLSSDWGSSPTEIGKVVWFELADHASSAPHQTFDPDE